MVDDVLLQGVKGISELITKPGLINVDFADVKAIMKESGSALMGIGQAGGENRAVDAAKIAIDSPLLELSIEGAKGVLFTITGPTDLSMNEVNEAARLITASVDSGAKIIFGTIIDDSLKGEVAITVIATGFAEDKAKRDSKFDGLGGGSFSIRGSSPTFMPTIKRDSDKELMSDSQDKPAKKIRLAIKDESSPYQARVGDGNDTEGELDIPAFIRRKMK